MSKYDRPFWVNVKPTYYITNDEDLIQEMRDLMKDNNNPMTDGFKDYQNGIHEGFDHSFGGRFDWGLAGDYTSPREPLIDVQMMRLWTLQMAQQLINGDSYTDQTHDNVNMEITKEELEIVNKVFVKAYMSTAKHTLDKHDELIAKRRPKKFSFNDETSNNNQEGPEDAEG